VSIAVLNDIHGNLPALEAVLVEVRAAGVERIVCGGDVIVGPMSGDALACLKECGTPVSFLLGNCEVAVLDEIAGRTPRVPESVRSGIRATAQQVHAFAESIAAWPKTIQLSVDGIGGVLFCHGTPRDENEIVTVRTPDERLRPLVEPWNVAMVVCGHTHMPFDRVVGATRVVNAGSVGMPFGPAGADWLLLGPGVWPRHTEYDLARAADRIRASGYPDAETFATSYVLSPPSAEQMLDAFGKAEAVPNR
jgi:predicted phosphodiesterase